MIIYPRAVGAAIAAVIAIGALAGCASSAPPSSPGSTKAADSSQPAVAPALTGLPKGCPAVALVDSKLGISAPNVEQNGTATTLNCMYLGTSVANSLSINFSTTKILTESAAEAALKTQGSTSAFSAVPGLGDFAFYDRVAAGGAYVAGDSGQLAYHIVVSGGETKQQLIDLAHAILGS
jgi:hypothetical protein